MKVNKYISAFAAVAGILAVSSFAPAEAFNRGNSVTMNGNPIFHIDCGAEGYSAEKRAWQAQDALDNALFLTNNPGPDCVSVASQNGAYVLKLNGCYIATADGASAASEGMTAEGLAEAWANSLKASLSDPAQTAAYIAKLKDPNKVQGVIIAERKLFAPMGTVLPVIFDCNLTASELSVGQEVNARIITSVPLGGYCIPAESLLIGKVVESRPGVYSVRMETLRIPGGTEMPISAVLTDRAYVDAVAPHAVATIGIPANSTTNTRVPAQIGIGTGQSASVVAMTFTREGGYKIARGQPTNVVLERVSSVAVVPGRLAM